MQAPESTQGPGEGSPHGVAALLGKVRAQGAVLLAGVEDPHAELLALVWGPRFDREHGLQLVLRQADRSAFTLPALLSAAERFDTLDARAQQRVRRLILRHRALGAAGAV